jgi:ubiquinone/menaquinone biosynthesis C-methylase UbiE
MSESSLPALTMPEMTCLGKFFVNRFRGWAHARVVRWIRGNLALDSSAKCLELGCGNGDLARRLLGIYRPSKYIATDYDPDQIAFARRLLAKRFPNGWPPALELRTADALRLDFPDASFDAVLAFAMLHHVGTTHGDFDAMRKALEEIDRVLRPSGCLVYGEFMKTAEVRSWLASRGYRIEAERRRFRWDQVVARKA